MAEVETIEVKVLDNGIHCISCETRITTVLSGVDGVQEAQADHKTQMVKVTVDAGQVTAKDVRDRLDDLGYDVEE